MRVAIGGRKSTNRQHHVYVCFEWRAVSEGERDMALGMYCLYSRQLWGNFTFSLHHQLWCVNYNYYKTKLVNDNPFIQLVTLLKFDPKSK